MLAYGLKPGLAGIGVVTALPQEARALGAMPADGEGIALIDAQWLVCVSGMGAARAEDAARRLLAQGASALLSFGVAAALSGELQTGHIVVPQVIIDRDGTLLPTHARWRECVCAKTSFDARPIIEAPAVLGTSAEKRAFASTTHAIAADMESAAVARVAQRAGAPFIAVRAIADDLDTAVPAWLEHAIDERGRIQPGRMTWQLLTHLGEAGSVMRLARAFGTAQKALARFHTDHLQPVPA
jgi:adenosylhomocysteine nucleosidase